MEIRACKRYRRAGHGGRDGQTSHILYPHSKLLLRIEDTLDIWPEDTVVRGKSYPTDTSVTVGLNTSAMFIGLHAWTVACEPGVSLWMYSNRHASKRP